MKIEEAIKMLKDWNEDLAFFDDEKDGIECHNLAISALEKQIPKKPYEDYNGEIHKDKCPICCRSLFPNEHHCKCGQALDWSD